MARRIIVRTADGAHPVLVETPADDEYQLQELVKTNPDLLPIDEFGLTPPLLIIGREAQVTSGAVDLAAIARGGELLVIEFKTGPQNSDFRHALSQLVDYGSDLWGLSYDDFEQTVPLRFFQSERADTKFGSVKTLLDAAKVVWPDLSEEECDRFRSRIEERLRAGAFHYVLVAQRFTAGSQRTVEYLNATSKEASYHAVELVRFRGDTTEAFEARALTRPRAIGPTTETTNERALVDEIEDDAYRQAVENLFELSRGLGYRFEAGSTGISIRLPTSDMAEPMTIAWIFPPGRAGWMGLRDVTLGFEESAAERRPSARIALSSYKQSIASLRGAVGEKGSGMASAYHLDPQDFAGQWPVIADALATLARMAEEEA